MLPACFRPLLRAAFVGFAFSACGTSSDSSLGATTAPQSASSNHAASAGSSATADAAAPSGTVAVSTATLSTTPPNTASSQAIPGHSSSPDDLTPDAATSGEPAGTSAGAPAPSDAAALDASAVTGDAQTNTTADAGLTCDSRAVRCRIAEPTCPYGEVPAIVDGCYGACTPIEVCPCMSPEECPQSDKYTCINSSHHCSPYLF